MDSWPTGLFAFDFQAFDFKRGAAKGGGLPRSDTAALSGVGHHAVAGQGGIEALVLDAGDRGSVTGEIGDVGSGRTWAAVSACAMLGVV